MIDRFQQSVKDPAKFSLLIAVLFFIGILFSIYFLYTLPHDLVFKGGMISSGLATGVFTKLFIVIGITFGLGIFAVNVALKAKKETIVYLEKKAESQTTQQLNDDGTEAESIDVQGFRGSLKGIKNKTEIAQKGLNAICKLLNAGQGAWYAAVTQDGKRLVQLRSGFALTIGETETIEFEYGDGLVGQAAASGKTIYIDELPEGYSNTIISGLGSAVPKYLFIAAIKKDNVVKAVLEIATFSPLKESQQKTAEEMGQVLAESL